MGAITAKRERLIQDEHGRIKDRILRTISDLSSIANDVRLFALFAHQENLDGGDVDSSDIAQIEAEYNAALPGLQAIVTMLVGVGDLNTDPDPTAVQAAIDTMIADNGLSSAFDNYKTRFDL